MRILVAGVGSTLWGDDGFGVKVAHRLQNLELPPEVKVIETGTGGIHLVQEITAGYDVLIVADASDQGRPPGTVMVIQPEVEDVHEMDDMTKYDFLADMHYTKPDRAFMLAKALKVLPERFILIGGQPEDPDRYGVGLSPVVEAAVDVAVIEIQRMIKEILAEERRESNGPTSDAAVVAAEPSPEANTTARG